MDKNKSARKTGTDTSGGASAGRDGDVSVPAFRARIAATNVGYYINPLAGRQDIDSHGARNRERRRQP